MDWRTHTMKSENSKYYKILGITRIASNDEIKKAYKTAAMKNHPDKGGDSEKFKELQQAYEVLRNPKTRDVYDHYGEEALKHKTGGDGGLYNPYNYYEDFWNRGYKYYADFWNRARGSSQGTRGRIGENVVLQLQVSLEEIYNGCLKKLPHFQNVICFICKGTRSKPSATPSQCGWCQGTGKIIHQVVLYSTQVEEKCPYCDGSGLGEETCAQCKGRKVLLKKLELQVHIEKGMWQGQTITFPGLANEAPNTITGDLIVILQQQMHNKFQRKGDDLFVGHKLSLTEALCGFQFRFTHLDGRQLLIKSAPGKIIRPGQFKAVYNEGMPQYRMPNMKGRLCFIFKVAFPEDGALSLYQIKAIEGYLPPRTSSEMGLGECEETTLHDVNTDHGMWKKQPSRHEGYVGEPSDPPPYVYI